MIRISSGLLLCFALGVAVGPVCAQQSGRTTDPSGFTTVREISRRGQTIPFTATYGEIDDQSLIEISFDETRMAMPIIEGEEGVRQIEIRVEAFLTRGGTRTPIAPIDNYVVRRVGAETGGAGTQSTSGENVAVAYVYLDKPYDGDIYQNVPDTRLNLTEMGARDADSIEIQITNLQTQEGMVRIVRPQPFGFRTGISDSLLFLKRLNISEEDRKNGVDESNFGPAPGVTYGGTFLSRGNNVLRFLQPGVAMNVSFMNWKDPAFDLATGKFAPETKSGDVGVGMGGLFSLFNNVFQLSLGWNLQAETHRMYVGVGVSFVNLSQRLAGLIAQ